MKDSFKGFKTFLVEKSENDISHCQLTVRYEILVIINTKMSLRFFFFKAISCELQLLPFLKKNMH